MTAGPQDVRQSAGRTAWRRRSVRGGPQWLALSCLKIAAGLVTLAVVAAGILVVRMNAGPIAIDGLGQTISRALNERFGNGLHFSLGGTSLVQHGFGPSLVVDKLSVTGPDGTSIVMAPKAELAVDTFALMFGKIVPKRLEVFDVTLRAVLLKDGNLAIAAAEGSRPFLEIGRGGKDKSTEKTTETPAGDAQAGASAPSTKPLAEIDTSVPQERAVVMRQAAAGLRQFIDILTDPGSPIAAVDRLGISGGTLVIQDQETNQETVYKGLALAFDKHREVTSFGLSAEGPSRRWTISAMARGRPGGDRQFALKIKDLTIDELKLAAGSRSHGLDMDAPLGMHLDIGLHPDNSLSEAAGGFELGAGYLRTDDPDFEPLFVTAIGADFHWNGTTRRVVIDDLRYVEGQTHFKAAGDLVTPAHEGEPWAIALNLSEPGLFAPDRKGQEPITVDSGQMNGRLFLDRKTFSVDRLAFRPTEGGLALAGEIDWIHGPHVRLGGSLDPTPVQTIERVWPSPMASEVRAWIINHFEAGLVSNGRLQIDYDETDLKRMRADRAPADRSVSIDFNVSNGRVRYLDGVPPLDDVVGSAHITGRTSHIVVASATTNDRKITLTKGTFLVADSSKHPVHAVLSAHLSGSVEAVTDVLSREALKPYASLPLDPTTLHGQIEGELRKTIVLGVGAKPVASEATMKIDAKVTDFQADHLIGKENLENATLNVAVGDGVMKATGQGRLFGSPTTFEISQTGDSQPDALIGITLDDAARAKLGMPTVTGLTGPVTAHISTTLGDPAKIKAQVELDLGKASVEAAYLGLSKPANRPGKIAFNVASGANRLTIDQLAVDVGSLQAHGAVELGADNSFQSAHLSSLKISPGDDMKLDVSKNDDGYKLTVRGSSIDARPFLKALTSTPSNEASSASRYAKAEKKDVDAIKSFDVDLKSNLLTGFNKEVMSGAELKLSKRGAAIRQFALQGRFGGNAVSGSITNGGRIKISAQDAGALVSFIDLYKHMEGGSLTATMQMNGDSLGGYLEIHDFVLRDEPAIRRLVATSADLSAPGQNAEAARHINGGAVDFTRLKVSFEREGSRLDLRDATMYGPQIGLSVDGWLDYSHDRVGMKGTFVPAFAVNNLFSQIPVFGVFLGGKSNEGLLAITFNISGAASQPTLSINPLSVIAPGFLRNIFGVLDAPNAPPPNFSNANGAGEPSR